MTIFKAIVHYLSENPDKDSVNENIHVSEVLFSDSIDKILDIIKGMVKKKDNKKRMLYFTVSLIDKGNLV
jgi:hypothetical protein